MSGLGTNFNEGIVPSPGIYRNNTSYYTGYRWVDGDKVRFSSNVPEKIGGWQKEIVSGTFLGTPRALLSWSSLDSTRYAMVGTNLFLYVMSAGVYYNVTPFRASNSLTNKLTTVTSQSKVNINDVGNGVRTGDYVNFPSSVTYNGITLLGDYIVTDVVDADNFKIDSGTNASGSGTGGGVFTVKYYLEAGLSDSGVVGYGWGTSTWGASTWGTARTSGLLGDARMWCLQNWGEDILVLPIGGKLYYWDTSVGVTTPATNVSTAPSRSNFMIVSSTFRQCILFGTEDVSSVFDPMLIRWSDTEDYTTWTPSGTNSAGDFRLTKGNKIVGAIETKSGEIIVLTDTSAYRMRPTTGASVYEIELIGDSCGLLSPFAIGEIDGLVYWMSSSSFKMYTGQIRPLPSSLEDYIFDQRSSGRYNTDQTIKFHCGKNGDFNELWFFYATKDSTEINRYVIYNYGTDCWYDGNIERTCWADKAFSTRPLAYDASRNLYIHEQGKNNDASAMEAYIRLGDIDVSNGDKIGFCDRFITDGYIVGDMSLTVYGKKFPNSTEVSTKTYTFISSAEQLPIRIRGRLLSFKLSSNIYNGDFKLGKLKFAVKEDGFR